jgi:hypothetical protein
MQRSGLSWVEQLGDNATSRLQVSLDDFNLLPGMSQRGQASLWAPRAQRGVAPIRHRIDRSRGSERRE